MAAKNTNQNLTLNDQAQSSLVQRSDVPLGFPYKDYKQVLRKDFLYSCAYCTMTEYEASAIRFTIDHYEPVSARQDLENEYLNLMYCCDECNIRKGDIFPPPEARADGLRFFRPDDDFFTDHFDRNELLLQPISKMGDFNIEALDLNRPGLRRLRNIRSRLDDTGQYVLAGLLALRRMPIDQLPQAIKGRVAKAIQQCGNVAVSIEDKIDSILCSYGRSELIDSPEDSAIERDRMEKRGKQLSEYQLLYPGVWRGRKIGKTSK